MKKSFLIVICLCCLFVTPLHAADLDVHKIQGGGVTAWLIENNTLPVISMQLNFSHAGAVSDGPLAGRAALATSLMQEGAGQYDAHAFNEMLDFYAINMGLSVSQDDMSIGIECLSEHADKAFALLSALLTDPHMNPDDATRVTAEHLAYLTKLEEQPSYLAGRALQKAAFAGHVYAQPVNGTLDSIKALTLTQLKEYPQTLGKDNLQISVAGDISAGRLKAFMQQYLAALPDHAQLPDIAPATLQMKAAPIIIEKTIPQTEIRMAMPGISRKDTSFYAAYILNHIIGGSGLSSQLSEVLRHTNGLTYSIGSGLQTLDYANWLAIGFATKQESATKALQLTFDTLSKIATQGVTEEQFELAQSNITGSFPLNIDSNEERALYLSIMQKYDLGLDYLENRNAIMQEVTLQQVNAVAKTIIDPINKVVVLVGEVNE